MSRQRSLAREYAVYIGIRLALFAVALAVLLALSVNGIIALLAALVVSGLLSYPLARSQRQRVVEAFEARQRRRRRSD